MVGISTMNRISYVTRIALSKVRDTTSPFFLSRHFKNSPLFIVTGSARHAPRSSTYRKLYLLVQRHIVCNISYSIPIILLSRLSIISIPQRPVLYEMKTAIAILLSLAAFANAFTNGPSVSVGVGVGVVGKAVPRLSEQQQRNAVTFQQSPRG
jgi:hypothetical protein